MPTTPNQSTIDELRKLRRDIQRDLYRIGQPQELYDREIKRASRAKTLQWIDRRIVEIIERHG